MQQRTLAWERHVDYEDILLPVTQEIACNRNFEHGHTAPSVETLEKLGRAFDMPLYQLLYDGEDPPIPRVPIPGVGSNVGEGFPHQEAPRSAI